MIGDSDGYTVCSDIECERPAKVRGMCQTHYRKYRWSNDYVPYKHILSDINETLRTAICSKCGWVDIYSNGKRNGKRKYVCKEYHTGLSRKKLYGIEHEEFLRMVELQNGLCASGCGRPATHLDHNHDTGEIRLVLCNYCNTALGLVKESPEVLESLADYIRRFNV